MRKHLKSACITVLLMAGVLLSHISAWAEDPPPLLWSKTCNPGGGLDTAYGVAVDVSNNIIAVGYTNNGSNNDWRIYKYDPAGNLLWSQTNSSGYWNFVRGVAVDSDSNIIAVGYTNNGSNNDWLIHKYDTTGNLLWSQTYNGGSSDCAYGVTVDSGNNVVVVGYTYNGSNNDLLIRKYDSAGNLLWGQIYDSGNYDYAYGVAVDSGNNVIAVGYNDNGSLICKYDPAGNLLWSQIYDVGSRANGVAVDSNNNIIVVSYTYNGSSYDWLIHKYDSTGNLLWSKIYDSGFNDFAYGVAVDSGNNVIAVGYINNGSSYDWLIHKYDLVGNLLWSQTNDVGFRAYGVTVDSGNNIVAVGSTSGIPNYDWLICKYGMVFSTSVTPALDNPTPQVGETVCVQVNVADVSNLYAASFNLTYNPAVLDYTGITEGTFLNSNGQVSTSLQAAALNGNISSGQIVVGISRMGDVSGASGSGRLATLCFTVTGNYCSTSDIAFGEANLEGPAQDSLITATWNNGSLTVTLSPPANPVTADPGTHNQINLCWDTVSGVTSYEVYRSNTAGGAYTPIGTTASTCYQDTGCILPTLNYYYQVKALSGGTCVSALSPEVSGLAAGLLGDINNDGRADGRDLSRLGRVFGTGSDCRTDLNRSNLTDGEDLILLAVDFGKTL